MPLHGVGRLLCASQIPESDDDLIRLTKSLLPLVDREEIRVDHLNPLKPPDPPLPTASTAQLVAGAVNSGPVSLGRSKSSPSAEAHSRLFEPTRAHKGQRGQRHESPGSTWGFVIRSKRERSRVTSGECQTGWPTDEYVRGPRDHLPGAVDTSLAVPTAPMRKVR